MEVGAIRANDTSTTRSYTPDLGPRVNAPNVGAGSDTVSVLLVTVAVAYWLVAAWDAVNVTVPALTRVITPVLALLVATPVALLAYVIAPLLALVGAVVMLNDASPYVLDAATVNADSVGVS